MNTHHSIDPRDSQPLADPTHYRHAGKRVENVILPSHENIIAALQRAKAKGSIHPVISIDGQRYMITDVSATDTPSTLGKQYLLPYYEREDHAYLRQTKRMLKSRIERFFELAQSGIRVERSSEEILDAVEHYRQVGSGGPQLVGSIMDHLESLGTAILDTDKMDPKSSKVMKGHRQKLVAEFRYFYTLLAFGEPMAYFGKDIRWDKLPPACPTPPIDAAKLLGTLTLRDNKTDQDGLLSYFVREVGKVLTVETNSKFTTMSADELKESRREIEHKAREAVTRNVGWACGAIDHVHNSMNSFVISAPSFKKFLNQAKAEIEPDENGLGITGLGFVLQDFTNKARARACVRIKDSIHFKTIDREFLDSAETLRTMLKKMRGLDRVPPDVQDALKLANEGIDLISNMAQSRMPRDHNAPAFASRIDAGSENSSVGMYEAELSKWAALPRSRGTRKIG